uniref:Putative secreted protein n=1 Tax=Anopheles darlingi TaxID=43151 RepID=A0A2M4DNB6_ANODA
MRIIRRWVVGGWGCYAFPPANAHTSSLTTCVSRAHVSLCVCVSRSRKRAGGREVRLSRAKNQDLAQSTTTTTTTTAAAAAAGYR